MRPIRPTNDADNKLDGKFKQELRNMQVTPPAGLWDALSDELDTERERVKYDHWYYAAVLLLIPLTIINLFFSADVESYYDTMANGQQIGRTYDGTYRIAQEYPAQISDLSDNYQYYINDPLNMTLYNYQETPIYAGVGPVRKIRTPYTPYQMWVNGDLGGPTYIAGAGTTKKKRQRHSKIANETSGSDFLIALQSPVAAPNTMFASTVEMPDVETFLPLQKEAARTKKISGKQIPLKTDPLGMMRGFYVGADVSLTSTRVFLSEDALRPLIGKDIIYDFTGGYQYGISVGYNFSNKFAIEAEWIIASKQGQNFVDNRFSKLYLDGVIDLKYTQVPLMLKYKISHLSKLTKKPVALNLVGGLAYSRLQSASITLNEDKIENAEELFSQNQVGLLLGVEYDMYLNKYMFLSLGVRGSFYGDTKYFKTIGQDVPRTYDMLLGVNASLNFQLPKRPKKTKVY